jgi:hypothetical protein
MAAPNPTSDKLRLQIDLSPAQIHELERLMALCEVPTKKDLFNTALTLFKWATDEVARGRVIASLDEETQKYKELSMPALVAASRHRSAPHVTPAK